jgi:hypothetical protein
MSQLLVAQKQQTLQGFHQAGFSQLSIKHRILWLIPE